MKKELLIIDGYNMIGSWPELVKLKDKDEMEDARDLLLHELANYQQYEGMDIRVVFDAQLVPGLQKTY
ncbi:MAG: NYN domain-containing protein, partial [Carnobacterium sp.]|uniref:NYN domain-containing protein n=1 Tax=Carnobacterium sp. TaxID=48221 RepID=UPI002FC93B93